MFTSEGCNEKLKISILLIIISESSFLYSHRFLLHAEIVGGIFFSSWLTFSLKLRIFYLFLNSYNAFICSSLPYFSFLISSSYCSMIPGDFWGGAPRLLSIHQNCFLPIFSLQFYFLDDGTCHSSLRLFFKMPSSEARQDF